MTYQHGNWFCKPANEAEAREFVERAAASGAEIFEQVGQRPSMGEWHWNVHSAWGVAKGATFTSDPDDQYSPLFGAQEYTIEKVRELFPLPAEQK